MTGSPTLITLISFDNANGAYPFGSLIVDANGDLFGTTEQGGSSGSGTVFEIKNNGTVAAPNYAATPTTLASFNSANGAYPLGSLIVDANGDLFGTTYQGGLSGYGTVFEIKNNGTVAAPNYAATPTTLASFNNANGAYPLYESLIVDANGDLFGTTYQGGSTSSGTVFEIKNNGTVAAPNYAATPTTLASFNNANGAYPLGSLKVDANGDLFGTTQQGGAAGGYGTVFEIKNNGTVAAPNYAATPTTLASFNNANGAYPVGSLIVDANGDLLGTTEEGGSTGYGTVFEIRNNGTRRRAKLCGDADDARQLQLRKWCRSGRKSDRRRQRRSVRHGAGRRINRLRHGVRDQEQRHRRRAKLCGDADDARQLQQREWRISGRKSESRRQWRSVRHDGARRSGRRLRDSLRDHEFRIYFRLGRDLPCARGEYGDGRSGRNL
jgi:uncharacterized repeat protein (TIGR03803 family)